MNDFKGKGAVITGGASGIGKGIAEALAAEGANLVIADLDAGAARSVAESLAKTGVTAVAVATDVRDAASVEALAKAARAKLGRVDLLFNNAGVYLGGEMRNVTEDDWRFVLDVNLDGVFRVGQTFAQIFREQGPGGHIVNTASVGGFVPFPGGLAYGVSKFGVVAYSEAMRADLEPDGIGVSTLCPGPIDTNLPASDRFRSSGGDAGGVSEALSPFIRDGMKPDEVAPIVLRGIRANLPYIFTDQTMRDFFAQRFDAILKGFDQISPVDEPA